MVRLVGRAERGSGATSGAEDMKHELAIKSIVEIISNTDNQLVSKAHYVLFFLSAEDKELHAYDTFEPLQAHKRISDKHPEFEFLRVESYSTKFSAQDICKIIRIGREVRLKLIPTSDLIKITTIKQVCSSEE